MSPASRFRLLLVASGWVLVLGCGSRTGLTSGRTLGAAGSAGSVSTAGSSGSQQMPAPECEVAADCPQPPPDRCGFVACNDGTCLLAVGDACNDGDPCTEDSCTNGGCQFKDGRVDADKDGAFASGNAADPKAALGCGTDCDDTSAQIFPGAVEACDAIDNDCNGVVDDNTGLVSSGMAPVRVSPRDAKRSSAAGLAFDGMSFGATMTNLLERTQGQFQQLDARGNRIGEPQRIAHVNAQAYGGPVVWTGERYLTAYQDARQDDNYEIYFDILNRSGERLIKDLRVTNADEFSLRPSVLWTGMEALLVWDDRRFRNNGDASVIFGQRVSSEGQLVGANVRLSPPGMRAENASTALSDTRVGVAFLALEAGDRPVLKFMSFSRTLDNPFVAQTIPFEDPDGPVVTTVNDGFVVTFHQTGSTVVGPSIYGVLVGKDGAIRGSPKSLTAGAPHARGNATFSYGDRFVMVWADDRTGSYQLYAQTFDQKLSPISDMIRVTTTMSDTLDMVVAPAADGSLGVLYTDDTLSQTFFTRLDCGPTLRFGLR